MATCVCREAHLPDACQGLVCQSGIRQHAAWLHDADYAGAAVRQHGGHISRQRSICLAADNAGISDAAGLLHCLWHASRAAEQHY